MFDDLIKSFKVQPDLDRSFWDTNNKLKPNIRKAMLRIAQAFYNELDIKVKPKIKDIVFTGSLANFNYSKYSDVDLHLLFDFSDIEADRDLVEKFFLLAKSNWGDRHDIKINGYEVEVYAEDYKNPHVSTGLYSILHDKWIKTPEKKTPVFDKLDVSTKIKYYIGLLTHAERLMHQNKLEGLDSKIKLIYEKLRKLRQSGLHQGGEFSTENIAFKALRRLGYIDKLKDLRHRVMDKQLSFSMK